MTFMENWSKAHFLPWRREMKWVEKQINQIQNTNHHLTTYEIENALQTKHDQLLRIEHAYWRQRSTNARESDGDRNKKYFHLEAKFRKAANQIWALRDSNGQITRQPNQIEDILIKHFEEVMTTQHVPYIVPNITDLLPKLTQSQAEQLLRQPQEEEVKKVLFQLHLDKSPGSDGLTPRYFQLLWNQAKDEIMDFIKTLFLQPQLFHRS